MTIVAISDLVNAAIGKPVARAARAARRALERLTPETEAAAPLVARKPKSSKGWRKHIREAKARERGSRA